MDVTRLGDARPYDAPGHHWMVGLRLQGWDAPPTTSSWVGLSQFPPGASGALGAAPRHPARSRAGRGARHARGGLR
jgi:hypothetical protein